MKLFRYLILPVLFFSCLGKDMRAGDLDGARLPVKVLYDVGFEMNFDNREYYKSDFSRSMTIFGARISPSLGLGTATDDGTEHGIMAGADVLKDFGTPGIVVTPTIFYRMQKSLGKTDMTVYAGIFPRKSMEGEYSQVFFSDSLKFYDNTLEGLLMKFRRPKAYFEVGCDWMGMYGQSSRERFMIFSAGEGKVAPFLHFGYAAYMYHYAGCRDVSGVVDNFLVNPYVRFDFSHQVDFQVLAFRFGWLQAMQNDRRNIGLYTFPYGGEFDVEIRKWNFGICNRLFYGTDMMPYYNFTDAIGVKYGNCLYLGDPFYRVHDDGAGGAGLYDRFEVFWNPSPGGLLDIHVGAVFHFNDFHYSGTQQVVRLCFNLHDMLTRKNK